MESNQVNIGGRVCALLARFGRTRFPAAFKGVIAFCALLIAAGFGYAEDKAKTPDDYNVIDLPGLEVMSKNRRKLESMTWRYGRVGEFEVLSSAPDGDANRLLRDFQKFRDAFSLVWPMTTKPVAEATIILCDKNNSFWEYSVDVGANRNGVFSRMLLDGERVALVIDTATRNYNANLQRKPVRLEVDFRRQLIREYARYLFDRSGTRMPPWLLEGNLQIVMDTELFDRVIKFGQLDMERGTPDPREMPKNGAFESVAEAVAAAKGRSDLLDRIGNGVSSVEPEQLADELGSVRVEEIAEYWRSDPPFNIALVNQKLIPLGEMFAVTQSEYEAINPLVDFMWVKQTHAFVHMCRFGVNGKYREAFEKFVARSDEPVTEAWFEECFEMSYAKMLKKLRGYISYPIHKYSYVKLKAEAPLFAEDVAFREATPSEVARIKGDALSLAGMSEESISALRRGLGKGDAQDGELLASLGLELFAVGRGDEARDYLEAAAKLNTARPSAWAALARLRLDALASGRSADATLTPEEAARVLVPLLKGRQCVPQILDTYVIMADTWERSSVPPNLVQINLISEGVRGFPENTELAVRVARFYANAGDKAHAAAVAQFALKYAKSAADRRSLENFLAEPES